MLCETFEKRKSVAPYHLIYGTWRTIVSTSSLQHTGSRFITVSFNDHCGFENGNEKNL